MSKSLFFYDLGSPYAYLAAARIDDLFVRPPEWVAVLAGGIFKALGKTPWPEAPERGERIREIEERARARGLPPIRWPDPWPNDWLRAMRAAVVAHDAGRGKPFAREAFRLHFVEGRPLASRRRSPPARSAPVSIPTRRWPRPTIPGSSSGCGRRPSERSPSASRACRPWSSGARSSGATTASRPRRVTLLRAGRRAAPASNSSYLASRLPASDP